MTTIANKIIERDIKEVIHFTTNTGFLGMIFKKNILPNSKLKAENTLAFIFQQNSEKRKEKNLVWLSYINLSISKLNSSFFDYSKYIHRNKDMYWVILSFSPEIMTHNGVYFTTTNNIYPSCTRGEGISAFNAMFNDPVEGLRQKMFPRTRLHKDSWTTCEQAEILYPNELSLSYLNKIYVHSESDKHSVCAQMRLFNFSVPVEVSPNTFN